MPALVRYSHVSLSVRDLSVSTTFYCDVFGFTILEDITGASWIENVLVHPSGVVLTLQQHHTNAGERFDPVRTGADHVALLVPDRAAIDEWASYLSTLGVDHSAPVDAEYGTVLSVKDPDGIALELFHRERHP